LFSTYDEKFSRRYNRSLPVVIYSGAKSKKYKSRLPVATYGGAKLKKYKDLYFLKIRTSYIATKNFYLYFFWQKNIL
jgi:hypothetical protein